MPATGGMTVTAAVVVAFAVTGGEQLRRLEICDGHVDVHDAYLAAAGAAARRAHLRLTPHKAWQGKTCVLELMLASAEGWSASPDAVRRLPHVAERAVVRVPQASQIVKLSAADASLLQRAVQGGLLAPNLDRTMAQLGVTGASLPFAAEPLTLREWAAAHGRQRQCDRAVLSNWAGSALPSLSITAIDRAGDHITGRSTDTS